MATAQHTFSESWYRIADKRLSLRPYAEVHRQYFRGEKWFVVHDPFNNQFYRLRPAAYQFVARLRPNRTVQDVWHECIDKFPDTAPGQEEVIRLLSQLYHANLLQYEEASDSASLFERHKKRQRRETRAKLLSIMFMRFPLFDPDPALKRFMPLARLVISPWGAILWIAVVSLAIKVAVENLGALGEQAQGVLAPGNLPLLYLGLILIKAAHEFGHSFVCRRYGGQVHTMGIMLLIFTPLPYMDASSAWAFRNKWKRAFVGGAGMIVEVFGAALATLIWARTAPGTLHSLAYNMMFIASVSTVLFNANPLLRFDGYYILSDMLDIPNLHQQAGAQLKHIVERYAFGYRQSVCPAQSAKEYFWLTFFGIASRLYKVVVFTGILLFVADRFLLAGIIMFAVCLVSWILVPLGSFFKYLATSPHLDRTRPRAVAVSAIFGLLLVSALYWIELPNRFRAPGVLQASPHANVVAGSSGFLDEFLVDPGRHVEKGQALITLRNASLEFQSRSTEAELNQAQAMIRQALATEVANLAPLRDRVEAIRERLDELRQKQEKCTVRAPQSGYWTWTHHRDRTGSWIERGRPLGKVLNTDEVTFTAVVSQREASRLFSGGLGHAEVRFPGDAEQRLAVTALDVVPVRLDELPSSALGWPGGGNVRVDQRSRTGTRAKEGFFQVHADLEQPRTLRCFHGRSGTVRFDLAKKPLLVQWWRALRQMLQRRYGF